MPMATGDGGDSGENAESADGGTEEDISTQEESAAAIPGRAGNVSRDEAKLAAGEVDVEPAGDSDVDYATAALGEREAADVSVEETEEKSAPKEEKQEEEEDDGETVYLPSGDKDFRLFRAKLRAGSDEKWREQLKRNVNVAQLGGQDAWAHELNAPEKGCLIVAKSSVFSLTQTYFNEVSVSSTTWCTWFGVCASMCVGCMIRYQSQSLVFVLLIMRVIYVHTNSTHVDTDTLY